MNSHYAFLLAAACFQSLPAQIVAGNSIASGPPKETITETTVIPLSPPGLSTDTANSRRHLLTLPRDVDVPAHPPGTVVETTETKSYVDVPGQPRRIYNVERNVVIVEGKELPYITIPVLFEKETSKLLDMESRVALEETAAAILEVLKTHPAAVFDIEGHTSTDGTNEFNITLSADRARRIHQELTQRYSIPATVLSAHGYGEMYPSFPNGNEEQMMLDRRVLVVRKQ
jgi:outer membrane protein OmpA-like peptidoglycan-associated protein